MKTTTKWILGILIGLVVVVALVAFGLLVVNRWGGAGWMMSGRAMPWGGFPGREIPMHPFWRVPIDRFGGYYPLRMIAGSLIWLGLLTLIVLGVISLVRGLTRPQQPANVSGSAASAPEPLSAQAPSWTCPHCQYPLQDAWKHCPNCGVALLDALKNEIPQA